MTPADVEQALGHNNACIWELAETYCTECEAHIQYIGELEDSGITEYDDQDRL